MSVPHPSPSPAAVRYPHLFAPIRLGPMILRHRATMSGHGMHLSDGSGGVSDALRAYVSRRARGGASLLGTESAPIHDTSRNDFLAVNLFDDAVVPSLQRLADEVHAAGSKLSIILWHGGHNVSFTGGRAAVAASPIPSTARETPKQLSQREIAEIVKSYGKAAARCRKAGLDAVEVQTATSYLLGGFLSPAMNHRTDSYGGSFTNRLRIVREILEEIRAAAGTTMAVGVRTSTSHHIPNAPIDYTIEESIAAMKEVSDAGLVDWVSILSGSRWNPAEVIPAMNRPRNQLFEEGKRFRAALKVPLIVAGRIRSPTDAEQMIAEGGADIVAMARTWIAEPDWARKIEEGRDEAIRPCMSCSQGCAGFAFKGLAATCVINPTAGRELRLPEPERTASPRHIAVIGGGPGGMEAARIAALRGHRVSLYEASGQLGGQMRLAGGAPHRDEMLPVLGWWENELRNLQVRIHLNRPVKQGEAIEADSVIWAVGAEPWHTAVWRARPYLKDGIPGTAGLPHGRDVLAGNADVRGAIAIIDEEGGWPAISLAESLIGRPGVRRVSVFTSEKTWGESDLTFTREIGDITRRIQQSGIHVVTDATVKTVADGKILLATGVSHGPFDTIVLSTGTRARPWPEEAQAVGDCVAPRGIWAATHDAAVLARAI